MMLRHLFSVLAFPVLLWACAPSVPGDIISEDKMEDLLVDFHLAQGMAETVTDDKDKARYEYIQTVFKKHRVTEAEFDSSMIYYSGKSEIFSHIYNNVALRVRVEAERMGLEASAKKDNFANLTHEGDTANIWLGRDFACVMADPIHCYYTFQISADTTFHTGDYFIWRFNSQFVKPSINNEAIAQLTLYFDTDTTLTTTELIRNGKNELKVTPSERLDSLALKSIRGFVYLPTNRKDDRAQPLLLNGMTLVRIHKPMPKEKPVTPDAGTLPSDSLSSDSLAETQDRDTIRLTPMQRRESQPRRHKINVVKENPNPIRPQRGYSNRSVKQRRR